MSDPAELLARFYDAETNLLSGHGDFSAMAQTLHEDCVIVQPESLPYAGEWTGHDGYRRWMEAFSKAWTTLSVHDPRIYAAGEQTLFARSTVIATARTTGSEMPYPLLQMIWISADRIARIEPFYWDTHVVLKALSKAGA